MDAVDEIKNRLSIEDVVGRYVDLKRSGASFKGLCPFHQEKTPSFYVTPSRGTYHCFGCARGGDVFSFIMEMDKLSFPEALTRLAEQAGVTLPERAAEKPSLKGKLFEANEAAARFFREVLTTPQGTRARTYLEQRAFGAEAAEQFELGYAPEGREALVQRLRRDGLDDRVLLAAGLALQDDIGGKARDRFRGRLMFPIRDRSGRIVGFGGRTLGDAQPKYLNSPQTEIFDKSSVLFGIHHAHDAIREAGRAVLVEGYLDAIRAQRAGYRYTVASLGTAVTPQQLTLLSRETTTVILALDPDPAGQAAAARTSLNALAQVTQAKGRAAGSHAALDLRIATLPEEQGDPDELIRDEPERWEQALAEAVPAFDFYVARTLAALDRSSDSWRQEAIDQLLPLIQQFAGSAGWQAIWLERLAKETGIEFGSLQRTMPGAQPTRQRRKTRQEPGAATDIVRTTTSRALASDPQNGVERALLALLLKLVVLPARAAQLLDPNDLERPEHRTMAEALLRWQSSGNYDYEMLRETLPEGLRAYADELHGLEIPLPEDDKVSVAVAYHLERALQFRLRTQVMQISQLLGEIAPDDRAAAVKRAGSLLDERRRLEQRLDRISQLTAQAAIVTQLDQGTIDQDSGSR